MKSARLVSICCSFAFCLAAIAGAACGGSDDPAGGAASAAGSGGASAGSGGASAGSGGASAGSGGASAGSGGASAGSGGVAGTGGAPGGQCTYSLDGGAQTPTDDCSAAANTDTDPKQVNVMIVAGGTSLPDLLNFGVTIKGDPSATTYTMGDIVMGAATLQKPGGETWTMQKKSGEPTLGSFTLTFTDVGTKTGAAGSTSLWTGMHGTLTTTLDPATVTGAAGTKVVTLSF